MWFQDIGNLVLSSFLIIILVPPIEFLCFWLLGYIFRALDQGKLCCARHYSAKTKKKTILDYVNLYEGPIFDIEYQYAQLYIICLLSFLFGPLMPLVFVYGLIGLAILYITLKLRLAYSVKMFPAFDQKMNRVIMFSLYYLPLAYTVVAAWLYSNQQIF